MNLPIVATSVCHRTNLICEMSYALEKTKDRVGKMHGALHKSTKNQLVFKTINLHFSIELEKEKKSFVTF